MKEKLLLAAASLLGFATACENKRTVDMYGTPYFDYKVKGKVTDKEGAPVKGIEVGSQDAGPVTSGSDGSYELSGREWSFRQTTLTFTDIDGPENGGEFTEKKVTVEFTEADRTGKGEGWYEGTFSRSGVDAAILSAHWATCSRRIDSTSFERVSLLSSIFFTACTTCGLLRYSAMLRIVSSAA